MRAPRPWFGLLGTLVLAVLPAPAGALAVGSEFQVNTYTTSSQTTYYTNGAHLVAADASGHFVVVWSSFGQDGNGSGVFGQRYDSGGLPLGDEFQVNSLTMSNQRLPSVASAASGHFVVVWQGYPEVGGFGDIFGQRYDSAGGTLGSEFRVNSYTTFGQSVASVASDASGGFVVVWASFGGQDGSGTGVFGQRYDSAGVAQGDEFRVNSFTIFTQGYPSVASDAAGNFVVVWESYGQDGSSLGIFGQRYDSGGMAQGDEFRVNSYTMSGQRYPSVASDASGNFVVAWHSVVQDGSGYGVFGQRYDSAGVVQGDEFRVNSYTTNSQKSTSVASDASGNFVVAWHSLFQDGSGYGVFGQRYDSAGVAQEPEFQINSFTTSAQRSPSVGATGTNQFVVAWESSGQDGSGYGVFGQRFEFGRADSITVVVPSIALKWRIGSPQEIQWTHTLGIDSTFRIKLDRNDDGEYEELIAAAAPASSGDTGSFTWTVTGPPSRTARVRVTWTGNAAVSDTSDVTFRIKPAESDREP
jgi:hypothetical protein